MISSISSRILILTAVRIEQVSIQRALAQPGAPAAELQLIGMRAVGLSSLDLSRYSHVILAGLAGALDPALVVGDVVIDSAGHCPPAARGMRIGAIHTSDHLICSASEKQDLFRQTRALAVNMESAIVRDAATKAGIAFVGIRAISDSAGDEIDPAILDFVNEFGRPKMMKLSAAMLRRPALALKLRRLAPTPDSPAPNWPTPSSACFPSSEI